MQARLVPAWAFALLAAFLLVPALVQRPAAATQLQVTAAPIQTWKIDHGLPDLPDLGVDLSDCGDVEAYDEIVSGTEGDDELVAGNRRQILVGLGGDDLISGGNHDDCLLGGPGDDQLLGDNGKDVLLGGRGADELDGGSGQDLLDAGGDEGDTCVESNGPDEQLGCGTGPEELVATVEGEVVEPGPVSSGDGSSGSSPDGDAGSKGPQAPQKSPEKSPTDRPGTGGQVDEQQPAPPAQAEEQEAPEGTPAGETEITVP